MTKRRFASVGILSVCLAAAALAADNKPLRFVFQKADEGKLPMGWKAASTGKEKGGEWKVVADATTPSKSGYALAQVAQSANATFNLAIVDDSSVDNLEISVAFRAVNGEVDQGGGVVWRYVDENNYYVCRMNPLENNFRYYRIVDGVRKQLGSKGDLKIKAGEWHRIRVRMDGNHIECWLDSDKLLEGTDDTFAKAGKIGLWTKADAHTTFDDLNVSPSKPK